MSADTGQPEAPVIQEETAPQPAAPTMSVLVVDDDDAMRAAMVYILKHNGFDVAQASDGREALARLSDRPYDVVLLDLKMPVMDGLRTLQQMRKTPTMRSIPVVILSQNPDREMVVQCINLGVRDFVTKQNLDIEALFERLRGATKPPEEADSGDDSAPMPEPGQILPQTDREAWRQRAESLGRVKREETQQTIEDTALLPVFPASVNEVEEAIHAGESASSMVQQIEQEPALLLGLLDLANRSQESATDAVESETALQWLGNAGLEETIRNVREAEGAIPEESAPWVHRWWSHSVAVAQVAACLAPVVGISEAEGRAAGMLHDIGRLLVLTSNLAPQAIGCYQATSDMLIPTTAAEQALMVLSHKQIGTEICRRCNIPAQLATICDTHDFDDNARRRLDEHSARLSAVVSAADTIAKAAGYGSLPNDELMAMPESIVKAVDESQNAIHAALAEIQTLISWRVGAASAAIGGEDVSLKGIVIVALSSQDGPSNPFMHALTTAGANVTVLSEPTQLIDAKPLYDVLILDNTNESVVRVVPTLRRLNQEKSFAQIPRLLLARPSDEPETVIRQSGLELTTYQTPIRMQSLLRAVRNLAGS